MKIEKEIRNEDPSGKTIVLVLFVVSLIGGGSLAVKTGLQGFPPIRMALFRCILGIVVVGGIGFYYGISMRLRVKEFPRLLIIAVLYIFHYITLNVGTNLTSATRSTILLSLYPLFTVLFGHFLLPGDRLTLRKTTGMLTAFTGVLVILVPTLQGGSMPLMGDLIVVLSSCSLGLRITLTKVFVQDIYPYRLLVWLLGISIPCLLFISFLFERGQRIEWNLLSSAGLLYQGWIVTGFCFLILTSVLRKYKASKLVVFSFLMPVSGVLFSQLSGVLFSNLYPDEKLSFGSLTGTGLVALGIYFVNRQR